MEGFGQLEVLSSKKQELDPGQENLTTVSKEEFGTKGRQIGDESVCSRLASEYETAAWSVKTEAAPAAVPGTVPTLQWAH